MDQIEELKQLIEKLSCESATKQKLTDMLDSEGPSQAFADELTMALDLSNLALSHQYTAQIEEITKAQEDYESEVEKANAEFAAELESIKNEADAIELETNQELEQLELDITRESLQ